MWCAGNRHTLTLCDLAWSPSQTGIARLEAYLTAACVHDIFTSAKLCMTHESNILMQSEDATNDNAPYLSEINRPSKWNLNDWKETLHYSKNTIWHQRRSTRWQNRRTCTIRTELEQKNLRVAPQVFCYSELPYDTVTTLLFLPEVVTGNIWSPCARPPIWCSRCSMPDRTQSWQFA
jgi:hypothetical protein